MSTSKKTLTALAAAAFILAAATGCSGAGTYPGTVVSDAEREEYESARFGTASVPQVTENLSTSTAAASAVTEVLLHPQDWPSLAHGKLCEYTAALIQDAEDGGTVIPEKSRAAAERILKRC